jgi:putative transcriptional regulator
MNFTAMSDRAILAELGSRIARERLNLNMTQSALAVKAGVARYLIIRLEAGHGCTLENMIRILRGLGRLDQLDAFLPEPGLSPLQMVKLRGHARLRAATKRRRHSTMKE